MDKICIYCNKSFSSKCNLTRHQRTSKTCLKNKTENSRQIYKCELCGKELSSNQRLKSHQENACKKKGKAQNQTNITNINSNNITNNTINININVNSPHIGFEEFMTPENIKKYFRPPSEIAENGHELAIYTIDNVLLGIDKPIYICVDKRKKSFLYLTQEKEQKTDTRAWALTDYLSYYSPIEEVKPILKSNEYISSLSQNLPASVDERDAIVKIRENGQKYLAQLKRDEDICGSTYRYLRDNFETVYRPQIGLLYSILKDKKPTYDSLLKICKSNKNFKPNYGSYQEETINELCRQLFDRVNDVIIQPYY